MDRPDAGSKPAAGPEPRPPDPPTQVTPRAPEAETVAPAPPPAGPGPSPSETAFLLSAGVPPALADHPRYRVIKLLGQGGMGAVYLAEHRHMERPVALKVVSADLVGNADAVRRFRQEVTAAARLGPHPHVVAVHDADQVGDLHFLVMEYVEGQSLADYLRVKGPLPYAEACEYVRQAALGLQHASEQGMVHRDVKPHNLMRTPKGQVKVLDFGLARCGRETEKARTQLTQQGVLMGTADYMAPEQASDSRVADIRADVYSLGCTLYHLLTGRVPFPEGGTVEKIIKHAVEQAAPVGALRPDLPVGLVRAVERMMAKAPEQRYQTPGQVAEALAPYAAPGSHPPHAVEVIPLEVVPAFDRRPTPRPTATRRTNPILLRRIRWSANFLMLTGWIQGLVGCGMVMGGIGGETWMRLMAPLVIGLTVVTLVGAVKMKALQSYRWAQFAALSALVPVTPCFPFTVFFGLRALSCLNDPQARAAFPP